MRAKTRYQQMLLVELTRRGAGVGAALRAIPDQMEANGSI